MISLLFWSVVPLGARVINVDRDGGGDATTIQEGLDMAVDGDTVRVMRGTYVEEIWLDFLGKAVLLESMSGPALTTIEALQDGVRFNTGEGLGSVVRGFTITSGSNAVVCAGTSPIVEKNIIKKCNNAAVLCVDSSRAVIRENLIVNNLEEGIGVYTGSTPTIERNLIYGNGSWGINDVSGLGSFIRDNVVVGNDQGILAGDAPEVTGNLIAYNNHNGVRVGREVRNNIMLFTGVGINGTSGRYQVKSNNVIVGGPDGITYQVGFGDSLLNNVIVGCGMGIAVDSEVEPPVAKNNILMNNEWGVYCYPANEIALSYNAVWGNTLGDYFNCTPGEGSVSLDPGFVDPSNHHFALSSTSPLIDLGDPTILDPDSTRSDIGAYGGPDALPFAITLLPRDTILTRGQDNLLYDLILSNTTGLTQEVQAWTKVILASRESYPGNPLIGPVPLTLDPHETISTRNPISHPIPQNAPPGIYEYKALVGYPPGDVLADRNFFFYVRP